jgi:glycosyltransferase involved in cell wall biosynthesis
MRIAILWSHASGYSAACWRALQAMEGVKLKIWAYSSGDNSMNAPFIDQQLVHDLDCSLLDPNDSKHFESIKASLAAYKPNGILVTGWQNKNYRKIIMSKDLNSPTKIMGMDNPWSGTLKQRLSCSLRRRYVSNFSYIWVAGERTRQFAMRISKIPRIRNGVYSCDYKSLVGIGDERTRNNIEWPKRFLFVGRYVESKGLRQLLHAYGVYRKSVSDPWELHCCGTGPLKHILKGQEGITDLGFCQPDSLKHVYGDAGALILPSVYEPWGVVVAEAMASGLPVIASSACGSSVELVRDNYNGFVYDSTRIDDLAERLEWFSANRPRMRIMSQNCRATASAFTAELWAERLVDMIKDSNSATLGC